jgi:hypothetical protein
MTTPVVVSAARPRAIKAKSGDRMTDSDSPLYISSESGREHVRWEELLDWWPYRPLLRGDGLADAQSETFYAVSQQGGRRGDPRKEHAGALVVYAPPNVDASKLTFVELIDQGAVEINAFSYPAGSGTPMFSGDSAPGFDKYKKPVVVRGYAGRVMTFRKPQSNVDHRRVMWEESVADGAVVQWQVTSSSVLYSESEVLLFIEGLTERSS